MDRLTDFGETRRTDRVWDDLHSEMSGAHSEEGHNPRLKVKGQDQYSLGSNIGQFRLDLKRLNPGNGFL